MNPKAKKRMTATSAFSIGLVGGSLGTFKSWAANVSPEYASFIGALLAALVGGLVFSLLERRYVRPLLDEPFKHGA